MDHARQQHQSSSSMPLTSRLDHLDFIMKYLEGKHLTKCGANSSAVRGGSTGERNTVPMPLDLAVRDAYFKGSLMDRVASLEHRLFQLCLEMESSSTSSGTSGCSSSSQATSGYASSSQGSKSGPSILLPTFNNRINQVHNRAQPSHASNKPEEVQEKPQKEEQERKHSNPIKQKLGRSMTRKDGKTRNSSKKRPPPKWPHWKLLGC